MLRLAPLVLAALLICGCGPLRLLLDPRPNPFADQPDEAERAALVLRYGELADRLQATASFYDREVRKSHTKARVMTVLVGAGATGAGASIAVLAQPDVPAEARPGIASAGVSSAVLAGLMAVLPYAHQYHLKEAGYLRQAAGAWSDYGRIQASCASTLLLPETPLAQLGRCVDQLEEALVTARSFPADSPCRPPPDRDVARALERARGGGGGGGRPRPRTR